MNLLCYLVLISISQIYCLPVSTSLDKNKRYDLENESSPGSFFNALKS